MTQSLRPGDVLAYADKDNASHYKHMAILVGPTVIACHSKNRFNKDFTDVPFSLVTSIQIGYPSKDHSKDLTSLPHCDYPVTAGSLPHNPTPFGKSAHSLYPVAPPCRPRGNIAQKWQ